MRTSILPPGRRDAASRREAAAPTTPAQRVILALGLPVVLTIAAWSGYGIVAAVGRSSYTVTASAAVAGAHLNLNGDGDGITVEGGAATGSVLVSSTVTYDLTRPDIRPSLRVSRGPGGTAVGFSCPAGNCSDQADASLPAATAVSVTGSGGNVSVSGIAAPVSVDTGGGNVSVNAVTGNVDLTTEGGSVQGTGVSAPDISVNTDAGNGDGGGGGGGNVDLTLSTVPKDLQVNSSGGSATIQLPPNPAGYRLQLDGGCGSGASTSAAPSAAGAQPASWCGDVSSSVPSNPSSPNVIVVSSAGGQITIT